MEKFVGSKERSYSKVAIPQAGISQNISAVGNDHGRKVSLMY